MVEAGLASRGRRAIDGIHGRELWRSDGTDTGTELVRDINPGDGGANPGWLTNVAGTLFFRADNGTRGLELWKPVPYGGCNSKAST